MAVEHRELGGALHGGLGQLDVELQGVEPQRRALLVDDVENRMRLIVVLRAGHGHDLMRGGGAVGSLGLRHRTRPRHGWHEGDGQREGQGCGRKSFGQCFRVHGLPFRRYPMPYQAVPSSCQPLLSRISRSPASLV